MMWPEKQTNKQKTTTKKKKRRKKTRWACDILLYEKIGKTNEIMSKGQRNRLKGTYTNKSITNWAPKIIMTVINTAQWGIKIHHVGYLVNKILKTREWASLVERWVRIHPPRWRHGLQPRSGRTHVSRSAAGRGDTAGSPRAHAPQEKSPQAAAAPARCNQRKPARSGEDAAQPTADRDETNDKLEEEENSSF